MAYPILDQPSAFSRPRESWSKGDAQAVLAWMTGLIVPRTDALLRRFEMTWAGRQPGWLDRIEAGVRDRIWDTSMWTPSIGPQPIALRDRTIEQDLGPTLSAAGEALGLDLGLLLGRSFADELDGDAHWIIGSHGRTYVSDKLPVLRGRGKAEYDPILIGLNVARRYLPDHVAGQYEQPLSVLHGLWLERLSDPAWGTTAP